MTELNVIYADLSIHNRATTKPLWQWNKGQQLILTGRDLPEAYQVHFSNDPDFGISTTQIGGSSGVAIPDELLMSGRYVYAWLYLTDENSGQTKCYITIPVARRPKPYTYDPTPAQEDAIAETLNALNTGVARVTQLADQVESLKTEVEEDAALADNYSHDSEAWAVGQRKGADVSQDDITFLNNSKFFAEVAQQAASENGWVYLYIDDDGYLHYVKTPNAKLDFYIDNDGYLHVRKGA